MAQRPPIKDVRPRARQSTMIMMFIVRRSRNGVASNPGISVAIFVLIIARIANAVSQAIRPIRTPREVTAAGGSAGADRLNYETVGRLTRLPITMVRIRTTAARPSDEHISPRFRAALNEP